MVDMQLIFLGTSSAAPTLERGLSSIALMRGGELLLFDAGEGMQRNFIKAGLGMNRKMKIFISHMHADHCVGLLGLLQTMGLVVREKNYQVSCCQALHSVPSFAYCLEEFDRPGAFNVQEAKRLGIPEGNLYSKLQHGQNIIYQGETIKASNIVGPPRKGRKIGISGDTRPTDRLASFFRECDVLIFESTYSKDKQEKAIENGHSTAAEAATIAQKAEVDKLLLTHFSARYDETSLLVKEASAIHYNVEAAKDLKVVKISYRPEP